MTASRRHRDGRQAAALGRGVFRSKSRLWHTLAAGVVVFIMQFAHGPAAGFIYDSVQYWGAPNALITGGNVADAGVLQIRGVMSALVYLPPAFVSSLIGSETAAWTVLAWNALLAAVLCVVILERIAGLIAPGWRPLRVWVSAVVGGAVLSGFSRYPHLDVWSIALALLGVFLLCTSRRGWHAVLAAAVMVVAANLRPSYLAPLLLATVVLLVARPRFTAPVVFGTAAAAIPQIIFNAAVMGEVALSPVATPFLLRVQAAQATFAVRYDTVAFADRHPQQWYCDPGYARLVVDDPLATSPLDVVSSMMRHLPDSLWFVTQKVSSSLRWSFATPMENAPTSDTSLMTFLVVGVSALGLVALIAKTIAVWSSKPPRVVGLALLAFWFGTLVTVVLSIPETRFALPLVLVGLIGLIAQLPDAGETSLGRRTVIPALIAVALAIAIFLAGASGLSNPMPPGPLADARSCVSG